MNIDNHHLEEIMEGLLLWMILGAIEIGIFVALALAIHAKNPNALKGQQIAIGLALMFFCAFGGIAYMFYLLLNTEQPQPAPPANTP